MSTLQVIARLSIHEGKLAVFEEAAARCMKTVREKDTGTLQYAWYMNADRTECKVIETYRDSNAIFEHITNLSEELDELTSVSDMHLEIFGLPSDELVAATASMAPTIYSPLKRD